jgi:uncharacterized protein YecT (DUF1311 family)
LTDFSVIDANLKACLENDSSTPAVNNCNHAAEAEAVSRLNNIYHATVEKLSRSEKQEARRDAEILRRLIVSQEAWALFSAADCDFQSASMLGGTRESNVFTSCEYIKTKERVLSLAKDNDALLLN